MIEKVYDIIDEINSSEIKRRLDEIKKEIKENNDIKLLLDKFNETKLLYEKYNIKEDYIKSKIELMKNPVIKEYLNIQNEINLLSLEINQRINNIKNNTNK